MNGIERREHKARKCKLELAPHVTKRAIERNYHISKLREMIFRGKWLPHIFEDRRTCICKDGSQYWTIIIALGENTIFVITLYESSYSEIRDYKKFYK